MCRWNIWVSDSDLLTWQALKRGPAPQRLWSEPIQGLSLHPLAYDRGLLIPSSPSSLSPSIALIEPKVSSLLHGIDLFSRGFQHFRLLEFSLGHRRGVHSPASVSILQALWASRCTPAGRAQPQHMSSTRQLS